MDLREKLQLRAGMTIAVIGGPPTFDVVGVERARAEDADAVIGFAVRSDGLPELSAVVQAALDDRLAWIAYPKARGMGTDLTRDALVSLLAPKGVDPVRQVAIDDVWSAMRWRPTDR